MRQNARAVLEAWRNDVPKRAAQSIWTDGENIWSYGTCIATPDPDAPGQLIFNQTPYSVTTSGHQSALAAELRFSISRTLRSAPMGVNPAVLVRIANDPETVTT